MSREINANSFSILVKGVSSPGTAEQLTSHYIPDGLAVTVTARANNSGFMYVAFSQSDAQGTNRKLLMQGQSFELRIDDTSRIWYDADDTASRLEFTIQKAS